MINFKISDKDKLKIANRIIIKQKQDIEILEGIIKAFEKDKREKIL